MKPKGRPRVFDRDALHRLLYSRCDSRGVLNLSQSDLAEELGIGAPYMSQIIGDFKRTGRLVQISRTASRGQRATLFRVTDPDFWTDPLPKQDDLPPIARFRLTQRKKRDAPDFDQFT